ncbi:hypothetical protein SOASR032_08410 [Pragia fontium]|uniref:Uncharacterized protein n=1 Tax=Pragia fontium TaxID=82985 RepID=A0ABQ5LHE1_9GAMM|nr:HlyD family secretion protein [Pragia fontium]GKX62272.1 hypothetical protein SOASR032_08410 [Pragia fontium]
MEDKSDLSARNTASFYRISLVNLRSVILLFISALVCFILFSIFFKFNDSVAARGILISPEGDIQVKAPESGTLIEFAVIPGQKVTANSVLFWISKDHGVGSTPLSKYNHERLSLELERAKARLSLLDNLKQQQTQRFEQQQKLYDDSLQTMRTKQVQLKTLSANARRKYQASRQLAGKSLVSRTELDEVNSNMLTQELNEKIENGNILDLENRKSAAVSAHQIEINSIENEQFTLRTQISDIKRQILTDGTNRIAVLAPSDGTILSINLPKGRGLLANEETVMVLRLSEPAYMQAYLYIPATGVGNLEMNKEVRLRFDAFPVDKYGSVTAKLEEMHPVAIDLKSMMIEGDVKQNYYLARLTIPPSFRDAYGSQHLLLGGMTLNADLTIDRKPLIMLLLSPLERVRQRFF